MLVVRFASVRLSFALMISSLALAGCGGNKHIIEIDQRFSYNVVKTPFWFPDEKQLFPVEKEVLDRYGQPNFIRRWWREDGSFITSSDLAGRDKEKIAEEMAHQKTSYVYLAMKKEVVFSADHRSQYEQPISDALDLICKYGDPERNRPVIVEGRKRETWKWIDCGKMAILEDNRLVKLTDIGPGTGTGTIIFR